MSQVEEGKITREVVRKVQHELRKMFWEQWDPIGVNDDPRAEGEYDSYADEVCSFMINTPVIDEIKIHEYLRYVMYEYMGLDPHPMLENRTEQFGKELILFWQKIKTN